MSSILKLRLLGVRAFDNHEFEELEFFYPLTLICGQNGVGKTTIIESLRYVTTGDLPPNAKGGAFVHDPRMSSEREVLAQVKLLFRNTGGNKLVAARNMRLSMTGNGTSTFKTLEGYIKIQDKNNGDTGSVSSRCADLNVHIPLALGIPPAILNYVVFCHQEESLWPLSEPSVVKKRFDEIFEATKFTKALESLKTIRKEYMSNIKVEKVQVDHLEADQKRVREKRKILAELAYRTDELKGDCERLQKERVLKSNELNMVVEHSQKAQQLAYIANDIGRQRESTEQNVELLRSDTRELLESVSTEKISELFEESTERESKLDQEAETLRNRRLSISAHMEQKQQNLAVLANQQGRIEQLQEEHHDKLARLQVLTGDQQPIEWRHNLESELQELNSKLEDLELSHRQIEEAMSKQVSSVEAEQLQQRQILNNSRNAYRELEHRVSSLNGDIADLRTATDPEESFELIQTRISDLENELSDAQSQLQNFELENLVLHAANEVSNAERRADEARFALQEAIEASSAQSRLQYLKDNQSEIKGLLSSAIQKLEASLKATGEHFQTSDEIEDVAEVATIIEKHVLQLLERTTSIENDSEKELARAEAEMESLEKTLTEMNVKLNKQEASQSQIMTEVPPHITMENFDDKLEIADADLLAAAEEQEQLSFAFSYFGAALKAAQRTDQPVCMLCEHHKSPPEAETLILKLKDKISALNISPEAAKAECESKRESLQALKRLKPLVDKLKQLQQDLEMSHSEIEVCHSKLKLATKRKEAAVDSNIKTRKQSEILRNSMDPALKQLGRYREQYVSISKKVGMEASIFSSSQVEKSPQIAQKELDQIEFELKQTRLKFDRTRSESERLKVRCSSLTHAMQELKLKLSDAELKTEKLRRFEQQLAEVKQTSLESQKEFVLAQKRIPQIEQKVDDIRKELRDKKHEHAQEERKFAEERTVIVSKLKGYDELTSQIDDFLRTHGDNPLGRLQEESESIKSSIQVLGADATAIDTKLSEAERIRADFGSYRRNLNDNLRLRTLAAELEQINIKHQRAKLELKQARDEIGGDYEAKIRTLQQAVGDLNHEIATKTGESKALREQYQQIQNELKTVYLETEMQHSRAVVKLETSEGAVEDLVKYVKALDGAIMQYHSLKMGEINALLDELWKSTYTGTDIDSIHIKSESDTGSASTRATYNYRVCMLKHDLELDMRGRCSAGQKVLASILIRMALAECFGSNSGLIVLDEPTTNLDRENIEALARSLSDIIELRRAQKNFQLIVITHDEQFLSQMNPANYCNSYYRVLRDERQLSKVHKMPIKNLNL